MPDFTTEIIEREQELRTDRLIYESPLQQISEVIRPLRRDIGQAIITPGSSRRELIFDGTPEHALDNYAAGIYGTMTNPASAWFGLSTGDPDFDEFFPVQLYLKMATGLLQSSLSPSISNFYTNAPELFLDHGAFGTAHFLSELSADGNRIIDQTRSFQQIVVDVDADGNIDTWYERNMWTARQMIQKFGDDVHDDVKKAQANKDNKKFIVIRALQPNTDFREGMFGSAGMEFISTYVDKDNEHQMRQGGTHESPYMTPRASVASGEIYGRGLGHKALADVLTLNNQALSNLKAGNFASDPTLLATDEASITPKNVQPGRIIYGGMDRRGRQMVAPLNMGASLPISIEMQNQTREMVKDAFFFSLMQLVGRSGMTATEVLTRNEEKMSMMGPIAGRVQVEFLAPFIQRRLGILARANILPPPPPELADRGLQVVFESPMAQALKAQQGVKTIQWMEAVKSVAELKPEVSDTIDGDNVVRTLADSFGIDPDNLLAPDVVADNREARAQQEQMAMALEAGKQGSEIASNLSGIPAVQEAIGG